MTDPIFDFSRPLDPEVYREDNLSTRKCMTCGDTFPLAGRTRGSVVCKPCADAYCVECGHGHYNRITQTYTVCHICGCEGQEEEQR